MSTKEKHAFKKAARQMTAYDENPGAYRPILDTLIRVPKGMQLQVPFTHMLVTRAYADAINAEVVQRSVQ